MKKITAAMFLACVFTPITALAVPESTALRVLGRIQYNGYGDVPYFSLKSPEKWGAAGCPNASYVQVGTSAAQGKKQILAIALSAYASGKQVKFFGNCSSNPDFFDAIEITIED